MTFRLRLVVVLLLVGACSSAGVWAQYCQDYTGLIINTDGSGPCDAAPTIMRPIGVQSFWWGNSQMLMVNIGNELRLYDLSPPHSPLMPSLVDTSNFDIVIHSDIDQNLWQFGLNDNSRFATVGFGIEGSGVTDLGTGGTPNFTAVGTWGPGGSSPDTRGGFGFGHGGAQYVVGSNFPGGCGGGAAIYLATGVGNLTRLSCLGFDIGRGWYIEGSNDTGYLYVMDVWGRIRAYSFVGSPANLTDHGVFAQCESDEGFDVDTAAQLAISVDYNGITLFDIVDPANPVEYTVETGFSGNIIAISYPLAFVAAAPQEDQGHLLDISDPENIIGLDANFWSDPTAQWNTLNCNDDYSATFSRDGNTLYLARFSVLQKVDVSDCPPPPPVPQEVFSDGFETGNLSRWSGSQP